MGSLVCFKHSDYEGKAAPVLSCKTCCTIYIAEVKREQLAKAAQAKPFQWVSFRKPNESSQ